MIAGVMRPSERIPNAKPETSWSPHVFLRSRVEAETASSGP